MLFCTRSSCSIALLASHQEATVGVEATAKQSEKQPAPAVALVEVGHINVTARALPPSLEDYDRIVQLPVIGVSGNVLHRPLYPDQPEAKLFQFLLGLSSGSHIVAEAVLLHRTFGVIVQEREIILDKVRVDPALVAGVQKRLKVGGDLHRNDLCQPPNDGQNLREHVAFAELLEICVRGAGAAGGHLDFVGLADIEHELLVRVHFGPPWLGNIVQSEQRCELRPGTIPSLLLNFNCHSERSVSGVEKSLSRLLRDSSTSVGMTN